ncbi:MAG TPA: hypothetical protein VIS72_08675 [Anaerolineales bacterium]
MGKYSSHVKKQAAPKRNVVNPYMRGIGCLLMLIVPVFSYAIGDLLAAQGFGYQIIPPEWYGYMSIPPALANFAGLNWIFGRLANVEHLPATLAIAFVAIILLGGILSVIFGWMYSIFSPSKYGPYDVPPPRVKTKKYKR